MIRPESLASYIRKATDGTSNDLAYCGGYFAAAHADCDGVVRLVTNYLGEVPLYRAEHGGVTVWSNKAAAAGMLAGIKPELDGDAAREFILLSHCLDHRTLMARR